MELSQLRIAVTGAGGGLGSYFVKQLIAADATVIAGDMDASALRRLRRETNSNRLLAISLDVTDERSVHEFYTAAYAQCGTVNGLINSAGILRDGLLVQQRDGQIHTMTLAQWQQVMTVNLAGAFLMIRSFAAECLKANTAAGVVINLASLSRHGNPGQANYAASKAGLVAATHSWARELGTHSIRVCAVAPGVTETGFLDGIATERLETLRQSSPLGRFATVEEVWQAVRFCLENDYLTDTVVDIDGGAKMC